MQHHLVCDVCEPDTRLPPNAAIVFDSAEVHSPEQMLHRYPGCRFAVAAAQGPDIVLWRSDGGRFKLRTGNSTAGVAPSIFASAVYALETGGYDLEAVGGFTVRLGREQKYASIQRDD